MAQNRQNFTAMSSKRMNVLRPLFLGQPSLAPDCNVWLNFTYFLHRAAQSCRRYWYTNVISRNETLTKLGHVSEILLQTNKTAVILLKLKLFSR